MSLSIWPNVMECRRRSWTAHVSTMKSFIFNLQLLATKCPARDLSVKVRLCGMLGSGIGLHVD